jgi:hypothetical protein
VEQMCSRTTRIHIDYYGGMTQKQQHKQGLEDLISRLRYCNLRIDEDFKTILHENIILLNTMSNLLEGIKDEMTNSTYTMSAHIVSSLEALKLAEIQHVTERVNKLASLDWSSGHTLSRHYYRRNTIPNRFKYEQIDVVGVWHDEKSASKCILNTIVQHKLEILNKLEIDNEVELTSDVADEFFRKNISVFVYNKQKKIIQFHKNQKKILVGNKDVNNSEHRDNQFQIKVILRFDTQKAKLYVLTAYPILK